jgi:hypothetical protein
VSRLEDALLYAEDEHGKPIAKVHKHQIGYGVMPVRETPRHALSHANTDATEEQVELERREREARWKFDALPPIDRELLRMYLDRSAPREVRMPFPAGQRSELEQGGWLFVKYTGQGQRTALMVRSFPGQLTQAQMAAHLGLSVYQVRRRLSALDAAMVKFAEMRGWA